MPGMLLSSPSMTLRASILRLPAFFRALWRSALSYYCSALRRSRWPRMSITSWRPLTTMDTSTPTPTSASGCSTIRPARSIWRPLLTAGIGRLLELPPDSVLLSVRTLHARSFPRSSLQLVSSFRFTLCLARLTSDAGSWLTYLNTSLLEAVMGPCYCAISLFVVVVSLHSV